MTAGRVYTVLKPFTIQPLPQPTATGGWIFGGRKVNVEPGATITLGESVTYGSDAVPEVKATLADGTTGLVGFGVTLPWRGYLARKED